MPINLDKTAVRIFKNIIDQNHDNVITPDEAAQGINHLILAPISRVFPGIETDSVLNPENLGVFLSEDGTMGETELKVLLEQYLEFLANKTTAPSENIRVFENEFNKYSQYLQHINELPEYEMMDIEERDFGNPEINPNAVNYNFDEEDELQRAIALSLQNHNNNEDGHLSRVELLRDRGSSAAPTPGRTLTQLNNIIQVFDPVMGDDVSASEFFKEQDDYNPFIIRAQNGTFHGNAIDWPASSNAGKFYVECKDDTPGGFLGNVYGRYTKPDGRRFVKLDVAGSKTFVLIPSWYRNGNPPGIKYFQLVPAGNIFKFMSEVVESQRIPTDDPEFFLGAEHCAQTGPVGIYELQEITLQQLNQMIPIGGKKNIKNKSRILQKLKNKYNKLTKKSIIKKIKTRKLNKKSRKTRKLKPKKIIL